MPVLLLQNMKNFKVDWNDHIGDFIRLKATQPQVLSEMVKREEYHSHEKEVQRRLRHLKCQHDDLQSQLCQKNRHLEGLQAGSAAFLEKIHRLEEDCSSIQWQLQRNSRELQNRHKTKSSRSSLDGTNHTNSERSLAFIKKDLLKKVNYDYLKHQLQVEVQKLIAQKISIKEEMEKLTKRICSIQQTVKKNIKAEIVKEQIRKFRAKEQKLKREKLALIEKHRQILIESQKPAKTAKLMLALIQESSKKLQAFVKQAKKLVFSQKTRTSKRYEEFLNKNHRYRELIQAQRQFNRLLERNPELNGPYFQGMGTYEENEQKMIAQLAKREITSKDYISLENQLKNTAEYSYSLEQKEIALEQQIEELKKNLENKKIFFQNEKNGNKSNRSI